MSDPIKIVLTDDEQYIAIAYKDGLERAGYQVTVAHDGAEALTAIASVHPNLILLDLIMPKLNGFEVLKELQSNEDLKHIPVFVLSNLSQPTDEAEVKSLGALEYIVKAEVSLKELIERIQQVVGPASSPAV